uniref:C1q and TNF related 1 n=1 Tax=Microcebus murinus TaxID=30608 RepID=A0A8B7WMG8_MICMU|nr:complement C1q tumor necrosis factor-related protein 1 isoform X1 [Microcebus murinus]
MLEGGNRGDELEKDGFPECAGIGDGIGGGAPKVIRAKGPVPEVVRGEHAGSGLEVARPGGRRDEAEFRLCPGQPVTTLETASAKRKLRERRDGRGQGFQLWTCDTAGPVESPDGGDLRAEEKHDKYSPSQGQEPPASQCFRCCDPAAPLYQAAPVPQINITILKGEKGDRGDRGLQGKYGKTGSAGARGHVGPKGQKGSMGAPGDRCKNHYAAFSVGRRKPLHSNDYYQTVVFDTEFVNLYGHFNMFTGKFYCYVPGIYFFSLNVHTWNQKETYLHVMKNEEEAVILYAQVSDRSIMQSQSLMLELREQDEVWVRLFRGERENAIFSDEFDTYITFSGYLVKHAAEP